jgi:NIMA-interacting peptidyl-prolyl cis-trans isomerase 1
MPATGEKVRVRHILKKHKGSRRPSSWRQEVITQTKAEAVQQILAIKDQLEAAGETNGPEAMMNLFASIAMRESDCGSAQKGGDLGFFGHGDMQKPFEEASFELQVGALSGIVDTDSGIHVILRID